MSFVALHVLYIYIMGHKSATFSFAATLAKIDHISIILSLLQTLMNCRERVSNLPPLFKSVTALCGSKIVSFQMVSESQQRVARPDIGR